MSGISSLSSIGTLGRSAEFASQVATLTDEAPSSFAADLTKAAKKSSTDTTGKTEKDDATRKAFQDFVAGTFFKQMLKALRSGQDKPAYLHGGQAEEMFQSQLDQQVAEDLAKNHGSAFSDSLYESFRTQLDGGRFSATA